MGIVKENCGICDIELTEEDLKHFTYMDFYRTCKTHKEYSQCFQNEVVKKQLGLISEYSDNLKYCKICNQELSAEEQDAIQSFDFIITCKKHNEVRRIFHLEMAKLWFEYKKYNPHAVIEDTKGFHEWYHKNIV